MNESPSPDPATPAPDITGPPAPGATPSGPNAGDVVNEGHESEELQKKISDLEKKHGAEKKRADDLENKISSTRHFPSKRLPGKSVLDELNEWWEGK